jgi:predicted site-specific integrase-resolvase
MRSPRRPVPVPTMTPAEAADVLGIEPALALRLAQDGRFPVPVVRGGAAYRLPVPQVTTLSRAMRPGQTPKGSRWPGPS